MSNRYKALNSTTSLENAIYWGKSYKKNDSKSEQISIWKDGKKIMDI